MPAGVKNSFAALAMGGLTNEGSGVGGKENANTIVLGFRVRVKNSKLPCSTVVAIFQTVFPRKRMYNTVLHSSFVSSNVSGRKYGSFYVI